MEFAVEVMDADGNLAALRIFRGAQCLRNPLIYYKNGPVNLTNSNSSQVINGLWHRSPVTCGRYLQSPPWVGGRSHSMEHKWLWVVPVAACPSLPAEAHQVKVISLHLSSATALDFLPLCVCPASKQSTWLPVSVQQHHAAEQTQKVIVLEWDDTVY